MLHIQPKRLSDEIIQRLGFGPNAIGDEFTLKRYKRSLLSMRENNQREFGANEVIALALVYFNLKDFENFIELSESGIEKYGDKNILQMLTLGKIGLSADSESRMKALESWFNHPLNSGRESFSFRNEFASFHLYGKIIKFTQVPMVEVSVDKDYIARITFGPFESNRSWIEMTRVGLDEVFEISNEIILNIQNNELTEIKMNFLKNMIGEAALGYIMEHAIPVSAMNIDRTRFEKVAELVL